MSQDEQDFKIDDIKDDDEDKGRVTFDDNLASSHEIQPQTLLPQPPVSVNAGARYPEVRQRGYYSEILAEGARSCLEHVDEGPRGSTALSGLSLTLQHAPLADSFLTTDNSNQQQPGASTKIDLVSDFPEKAFQPKMQLMFYTAPGTCPRAVRLEREKRKYAEYQLEQLLAEEGLNSDDMMPKYHPPNGKKLDGTWAPYLFVEIFDDEEFEIRNPDEWLAMGIDKGVRKPIPGRALLPITDDKHHIDIRDPSIMWVWHSVGVLDYDIHSKLWLVQKLNNDGRVVDDEGNTVVDGGLLSTGHFLDLPSQYWIPRIQLMFLAEDPVKFASRVLAAYRSRDLTEALLRYHLYLDCMPMDGLGELDPTSLKRMIRLSKEETPVLKHKKKLEDAVQGLEKEVMVDYWRSMNTIILHKLVNENKQKFSYIILPIRDPQKIPMKGTIPMPKYDWDRKFEEFAFFSLLTKPEVVQAICKSEFECLEARNKQLFHVPLAKHMRLDEFEQTQSQATQQVSLFLKDTWIDNLQKYIRTSLRDSGKGWFNIFETDFYVYSKSKLKKFMELVKYCMQDSMRYLVLESLNNYVSMISDACYACQRLDSTYKWDNDLTISSLPPKKNPIFLVDLVLDVTGSHYSTPMELFPTTCVNLFDKAILALQNVPQLEQFILKDISWADNPLLECVGMYEPQIVSLRENLRQIIDKATIPMEAYCHQYDQFLDLQNQDITEYVSGFLRNYEAQHHTALEIKIEVEKHLLEKDVIEQLIPPFIIISAFYISTENVRQGLAKKRRAMANAILDLLARELRKSADEACEEFKRISRKLYDKPNTIEELAVMREWILTIPDLLDEQQEVIDRCLSDYDLIEEFFYNLSNDDFNARWTMFGWPHKIKMSIIQAEISLLEDEERFRKLQVADVSAFNEKLDNLTMSVASMVSYNDITKAHEVANEVRRIHKQLTDAQANAVLFNNRERLFSQPVTNYDKLNRLVKDFEPFRNLWISVSDWTKLHDSIMNDPLTSVDSEIVEKSVTDFYKTMHKSVKIFSELPSVQEVASQIKVAIEEFKPFIPLIQGLRNPGMRARHWELLSEELHINIIPKATLTFSKCLEMRLQDHIDIISKIAEVAGKEYAIEQALTKMTAEWEALKFEVLAYKNSGTYILKVSEEINQLLDDHIVMTQSMGFSPYKKPFEERIAKWETTLRTTQDVIDEWLQCQRQWLYLEPIFSSEDINRQLPVEGKRYATMDRMWRKIMKVAFDNPTVITLCPDSRLLNNLKECNKLLEQVQKGLSEYLETKRQSFPRFYFLSDDELLEILSQTKDPTAVQPHLRKCFENIAKLQFEDDLEITAMFSGEGEKIVFEKSTYPSGNVEEWMLEIENMMRDSIRIIIGKSLVDYKQIPRTDWVLKWPGQVVIAGCQTYWTQEVSDALENKDLKGLYVKLLAQLDGLRTLVRGDMTKIGRQTMSALIVIEVHARDVVNNMIVEDVHNINDFEWISQLRYYWIEENLKIRAVNAEFPYGYEYLGNTSRLVITPLTDRCYLTLTGALHLKFGGAPAGPAGTGKTETTKDLGKAFAVQCVVFNCSDQLDFMAMGKFFKGLASAGAWACFDEFNRIDIEVLSVVAQQITTIQKAQSQRLERFMFEGVELTLKASCAVFITMNPGYAGRTELPDNLKALFRPVAMMVPDYALIAEISLFSFGFSDARVLAKKIVTTFKLSSEQLSSQDHYDFGMRAVKSVISAAGNLKRQNPIMDEELICLRAIRDVNVPKFLMDDLKLFNGIVSDLFPNIKEEPVDYGDLLIAIQTAARKKNLKDVEGFVNKCIQLFETTIVRHGLMLVGPTGSGKTKCYEVLQAALSSLKNKISPDGGTFETVHTYVLNPKSITMGQLYGEFDLMTHEWTDGILSTLIRQGVVANGPDKRWYVFDGPVDAVWIENMNTVLDDNKKLCLSSGEIIKLLEEMTMMFEVADLAVASPATVSRCGMVYLEPSILGLQPFVECWILSLPDAIFPHRERLQKLFDFYLEDTVDFLRRNVREIIPTTNGQLTFGLLKLMETFMHPFMSDDLSIEARTMKKKSERQAAEKIPDEIVSKIAEAVESWFLFSLIWSFGATGDSDSRKKFDIFLRKKMSTQLVLLPIPAEGLVYDYRFDHGGTLSLTQDEDENEEEVVKEKKMQWVHWMMNMPEYIIKSEMRYSDIIVPTMDNVRLIHIAEQLLISKKPVLCVGPTGTGKTLSISDKLTKYMPPEYVTEFIVFSAKTTSNQTQDLIDSKLDKRRKGVFGPPIGKNLIFFIDDLNMPALEVFGAQPPIELIRQWCDFKGWYDRKAIGEFRSLIDMNFIVSMGPPGGGRNPISQRIVRHFNLIGFNELEEDSMKTVFGTILKFWLMRTAEICRPHEDKLVKCCIDVYRAIQAQLLPTPAKSHYTFNLRDLSKVFQGILMLEPESVLTIDQLLRLWFHESCRVFQDRLVNDQDRDWFKNLLIGKMNDEFNQKYEDIVKIEPLLYGDFMSVSIENKKYIEFTEHDKMLKVIEENLDDYNQINTAKMNLVLFMDAVRHICRIARIIRQPLGNALLLGMGGSGRQSLTRLAAHMAEFDCFQIELSKNYGIPEWRDDLKRIMLAAGLENKPIVFLFSDTQIKDDSFLEDLNNILNAGDVPNLYSFDDLERIYGDMKPLVQEVGMQSTKTNLFSAYTKRVRINLHTVITMSPIGEIFRSRLRQFPALVNCCTIDWFGQWPQEALESVALKFLNDIPELEVSEEVIKGLVMMCKEIHQSVTNFTEKYRQELSRHNYVTPTSYLELLGIFSKIYGLKKVELQQAKNRTKNGLDKLLYTEEIVQKLQEELEIMKPQLEQAVEESKATKEEIERDSIMAEETRVVVTREEAVAAKKTKECEAIRDDAQRDLDEALPALFESLESLKKLNKNDITEVRAMMRPPDGVRLVIEAVCIMKDVKPKKVPGEKPGVKIDDYWDAGKALLQDPGKFLESLFNYDKDNIADSVIQKIEPYIASENFQPSAIEKVSKACTSICQWARAMYKYHFVSKSVAPKREALERSEKELDETKRILKEARNKLKSVEDRIMGLQEKLEACNRRQKELENKSDLCEARLTRADKLIGGLSSEKIRWLESVVTLEYLINNIVGNVLLSAGYVAYLGTFTGEYRNDMCHAWTNSLKTYGVPHTDKPAANLVDTFGDPVKIRNWQIDGLPKDTLSTENAVIVQFSRRWPLFIDPQGQANRWIKNLQKDNGLDVIKLSDKDFLRSLENAVRFGKPCLLENVGEELDPALEPILLRQTFKQQGAVVIKLGDAIIPYHDDFRFYITTKLPNPHYTPEVSTKVTIVNFTLSPSGLEDQLLGMVVAEERPDLEDAKNQLIVSNAKMKQELKEIEDKILYRLSAAEGSPVDDIDLIQTLEASKLKSNEIQAKVIIAEQTEKDIDETRSRYIPVAVRTQILFFCVADLAHIDPMYQYSLEWFMNIFQNGITNANKADTLTERIDNINNYFTFSLYSNVCRSLFEKHKLLFSFLLSTRILQNDGKIDIIEWRYLLAGGTHKLKDLPNPAPEWISDRVWSEILTLGSLPNFNKFPDDFSNMYLDGFKKIYDSPDPHREELPGQWNDLCDRFQKLLVLRCLRMDKVTNAMQDFVAHFLGERFIEPQAADLTLVYKDSSPTTPLIFVLSPGTDPASDLYKFADDMKFSKKLSAISLGQGQGPRAEELLKGAMERGKWIFFQNCHLSPSWMPSLERLVEQIDRDKVHRDFRLWLTSMPSPKFPVFILQNGSKMTVEPPRGIKANLLKSYTGFSDESLNSVAKNSEWRHLLFSLCLFHGVLIERKKFGPLGFNIPYEFTDGDLRICINQLSMFLTEYIEVPFKVLKYTAGHINYGGRVTDDWDRRCLMSILGDFYDPRVMNEDYIYSESGVYRQIAPTNDHAGYLNYVRSLPINDTPEIFGLHENANITFAINATNEMLNDLLKLQPKASATGGMTREETVEQVSRDILASMPDIYDEEYISKKYPVMYEQSMNTVLIQEVIRYNRLLKTIMSSLKDLIKAIQGLVVMSEALENMSNSLYDNKVPDIWSSKAYPSLKPLASWVADLHQRIAFIQNWIDNGIPPVFWISGFFFPQAFLTGTLQNFARKKIISIDTISFNFRVVTNSWTEITEIPSDGCYIRGLFVEGARWDMGNMNLAESRPKDLFTEMPVIWLMPAANRIASTSGIYDCPVYKTLTRAGTLSTTGHSTNFVFSVEVPSNMDQDHWIKRGVALLCALNY